MEKSIMYGIMRVGMVSVLVGCFLVCGLSSANTIDGVGTEASFNEPWGITIDGSDNVYVADTRNYAIRKITPAGLVTTVAGNPGYGMAFKDGTGATALFFMPTAIATDLSGNVYVIDKHTIRKMTPAGEVTTLAGSSERSGSEDGVGSAARFWYPQALATDRTGNIYVSDASSIRRITAAGVVTTFFPAKPVSAGSGGTSNGVSFTASGIAIDSAGNVYVADTEYSVIRKITPAGIMTTLAGDAAHPGDNDGIGTNARFNKPSGVAIDSVGNVYVADTQNGAIRKITPAGVVTTVPGGTGLSIPRGVAVDRSGNIYVVDLPINAVRKITPAGKVTALAGQLPKDDAMFSGTLCHYNERVIFSCRLKGKEHKIASVCGSRIITATRGYMQYRYGKPDAVEIALPEQPGAPFKSWTGKHVTYAQTWSSSLTVRNGNYSYTVYGSKGVGDQPVGLTVEKDGKGIAGKECEDGNPPDIDFAVAGITDSLAE